MLGTTKFFKLQISILFPWIRTPFLTFPLRKASWIKRVAEIHGIFNMAEDTLRRSCENGENSYLFDLAGNNVKWKTISLTHVEYPEGNPGSVITILGF